MLGCPTILCKLRILDAVVQNVRTEFRPAALLDFVPRIQESVFTAHLDAELAGHRVAVDEADRCGVRPAALGTGEIVVEREFYII